MANRRQIRWHTAIGLIFFIILGSGCATRQEAIKDMVTTEYLLSQAGFQVYKPNMETPKSQALLDALPPGQITTFTANGRVYHAYPDNWSHTMYIGDEAAYQKYEAMATGQKVCRRLDAPNSAGFWGCFQELQGAGAVPR